MCPAAGLLSFGEEINILRLPVFELPIFQSIAYLNFLSCVSQCTYQGVGIQKHNFASLCVCEHLYLIEENEHCKGVSVQTVGENICASGRTGSLKELLKKKRDV